MRRPARCYACGIDPRNGRACRPKENTMAITSIESVLQQMRALTQASDRPAASGGEVASGGFAGELKKSLDRISQAQESASNQAEAFELGKPGVALNDVMVDLQKANIGLQMGLQVRNKVVAAYQEIMNMPA
jgi:flagellar hook-basal body complex protein FliE